MKHLLPLWLWVAFTCGASNATAQLLSVLPVDCTTKKYKVTPIENLQIVDSLTGQVYPCVLQGDFWTAQVVLEDKHLFLVTSNGVVDSVRSAQGGRVYSIGRSLVAVKISSQRTNSDFTEVNQFFEKYLKIAPLSKDRMVKISPAIDAYIIVDKEPAPLNLSELSDTLKAKNIPTEYFGGTVVIRVLIDTNGTIVRYRTLRAPNRYLIGIVESSINILRFTPGIQEGEPISCWVTVPIRFSR